MYQLSMLHPLETFDYIYLTVSYISMSPGIHYEISKLNIPAFCIFFCLCMKKRLKVAYEKDVMMF